MEILYWLMALVCAFAYYIGIRVFMPNMINDNVEKSIALFVCIICAIAWFITLPIMAVGLLIFLCTKKIEPLIIKLRKKLGITSNSDEGNYR
ncbi:MAG: hypothetical protein JHC33_15145 [Ignisphaera sp.]|nr:hypothetical protein [Ignisphaera sp.]